MVQVRRVRRIIRKFDPWTVLKVSLVLYFVLALAAVFGAVIFWELLGAAGIPQKIDATLAKITTDFIEGSIIPAEESLFKATIFLSISWVVLATGFTTLGALMYNLISDVVGGIEVIVLEESMQQQVQVQVPVVPAPVFTPPPTPPPSSRPASLGDEEMVDVDQATEVNPTV
jgi:ABC-type multidrug transport system fused ATPase/permease subunit